MSPYGIRLLWRDFALLPLPVAVRRLGRMAYAEQATVIASCAKRIEYCGRFAGHEADLRALIVRTTTENPKLRHLLPCQKTSARLAPALRSPTSTVHARHVGVESRCRMREGARSIGYFPIEHLMLRSPPLTWSPWRPLDMCWADRELTAPGLYRVRRAGRDDLDYIGSTRGAIRRSALLAEHLQACSP
jgi:hypothetical protein